MRTAVALLLLIPTSCSHRDVPGHRDGSAQPDLVYPRDGPSQPDLRNRDRIPDRASSPASWVVVKPGKFVMGSPISEQCRAPLHAETQHQVTLTHAFAMSKTEVTQQEFKTVMGYLPCFEYPPQYCIKPANCPSCPVANTSWHDAVAYCNALSDAQNLHKCYSDYGSNQTCASDEQCPPNSLESEVCVAGVCRLFRAGLSQSGAVSIYDCDGYRLPTEAEWEYAYRAGSTTAFYSGPIQHCDQDANADLIGWNKQNAQFKAHPTAMKTPNAWGFFDLAGNVQEWVHDLFIENLGSAAATNPEGPSAGSERTVRGGGWGTSPYGNGATSLRAAYRDTIPQQDRFTSAVDIGFRCVRTEK